MQFVGKLLSQSQYLGLRFHLKQVATALLKLRKKELLLLSSTQVLLSYLN
eukprot:c27085_g1_i1 orf=98-247(+)